ncbi:MAG: hypothetical protein AAGH71_06845 [Planctomycetota bacterium]
MNLTQKLRQLHADIAEAKDGFKIVDAWALAERLTLRLPVDLDEASRVFKDKDADGLLAIIDRLENPPKKEEAELPEFHHDDLAAAMRAFKKRLKVIRLNDESKLGGRYTSGGRTSKVDAIEPPGGFDPLIWRALAASGRLTDTGGGFYALAEGGGG